MIFVVKTHNVSKFGRRYTNMLTVALTGEQGSILLSFSSFYLLDTVWFEFRKVNFYYR